MNSNLQFFMIIATQQENKKVAISQMAFIHRKTSLFQFTLSSRSLAIFLKLHNIINFELILDRTLPPLYISFFMKGASGRVIRALDYELVNPGSSPGPALRLFLLPLRDYVSSCLCTVSGHIKYPSPLVEEEGVLSWGQVLYYYTQGAPG